MYTVYACTYRYIFIATENPQDRECQCRSPCMYMLHRQGNTHRNRQCCFLFLCGRRAHSPPTRARLSRQDGICTHPGMCCEEILHFFYLDGWLESGDDICPEVVERALYPKVTSTAGHAGWPATLIKDICRQGYIRSSHLQRVWEGKTRIRRSFYLAFSTHGSIPPHILLCLQVFAVLRKTRRGCAHRIYTPASMAISTKSAHKYTFRTPIPVVHDTLLRAFRRG